MMQDTPEIVAHKITKPIQLLAAWLAGLAVINGSFLAAAGLVTNPTWLPALLAIAAVVNVPVFIVSLFLLQTKFRPEMQEDSFYSRYLERKFRTSPPMPPPNMDQQFAKLANEIVTIISAGVPDQQEKVIQLLKESEVEHMVNRFKDNRTLFELHLFPEDWSLIHEKWREDSLFQSQLASLSTSGLIEVPDGVVRKARLTALGRNVAEHIVSDGDETVQYNIKELRAWHANDIKKNE